MASSSLKQEKGNHGDDIKSIVLKKGKWLPEEDALLREYVRKYGAEKWDKVREKINLDRDGKSCRFRWLNCLKPSLKKCPFSEEEGRKLIHLYNELGPKWSQMVSKFPGRTDNELKNFINSRKRSLKYSREYFDPENINHVDKLNDNVGEINMTRGYRNQQNNASQEEEVAPPTKFAHQDILHGNYLDQVYDEKNINNFEQLSTLVDDSNMLYNNVGSSFLSNHVVPTLNDKIMPSSMEPECSYLQDMEDIFPSFSSCNMFLDQDLSLLPQWSYSQDMDYQLPSFSSCNTFLDQDLSLLPQWSYSQDMDYQLPSFSSSNMFLDQDLSLLPQWSYSQDMDYQLPSFSFGMFSDEKNLNNFEQLSTLVDDSNTLPECSYFQDMEDIVPSFSSCNIFSDQDLSLLPQWSYSQDEMFCDQYPQNPILSSQETQYEMLEPWLLSECVPFW